MHSARPPKRQRVRLNFGVYAPNRKLRVFKPVLRTWSRLVNRYASSFAENEQDVPYYYNERANISVLSAAAWFEGWIALEEYPGRKKSRPKGGRIDLYLAEASEGGREWVIEAKVQFLKAPIDAKKVAARLGSARRDAHGSSSDGAQLGLVFVVPYFRRESEKSTAPIKAIRQVISDCRGVPADLWAWCFPRSARDFCDARGKDEYWYPGVLIGIARKKHRYG